MKIVYFDIVCTNYSSFHKTIIVKAGNILFFYGFIFESHLASLRL